jgi:hypothetical protein
MVSPFLALRFIFLLYILALHRLKNFRLSNVICNLKIHLKDKNLGLVNLDHFP